MPKGSYEKDLLPPAPLAVRKPRSMLTWKRIAALLVLSTSIYSLSFPCPFPNPPLSVKDREKIFLSATSAESALEVSRALAGQPHLAGSPQDFEDAKTLLKVFQDAFHIHPPHSLPIYDAGSPQSRHATLGLTSRKSFRRPTTWIDVYYPLLNTPVSHTLEIVNNEGSTVWSADLEEDGDELDPDAHKYKDSVLAWHGMSKDGVAEGQLVYANYGTREDFDKLVAAGTDFTGKVVLVRYGQGFRGSKIEAAQDVGAVGVLIYSDARDDGLVTVENGYDAYPHGPARNPTAVERGSVQLSYPGDPTTPGYPAYKNSTRTEGASHPKIPSLPISWQNGQRLLEEIGDGFNVNGCVSKTKIRLTNRVDDKVTPIWNTMAAIPGHIRDEVVVIGNHRDAWVLGATDPISGTASLHEVVRGFGKLLESGWQPLRTIVFASWDAEEQGLIGSTEWGEDFPEWISQNVVAYINVDVSCYGSRWEVQASPSLADIIKKTASDVPHPTVKGKNLWDARNDIGSYFGNNVTAAALVKSKQSASHTEEGPLGSGSDFTVFLQRLGIASTDTAFVQTETDPPYPFHSIYDTQRWQEVYGDPGFHRHLAVAQYLGLLALHLADSIILPLNTTQYSFELDDYLDKVEAIKGDGVSLTFPKLRQAIKKLQSASQVLDEEKARAEKALEDIISKRSKCRHGRFLRSVKDYVKCIFGMETPSAGNWWKELLELDLEEPTDAHARFPIHKFIKVAKRVHAANKKLAAFERGFISEDGLRGREWYRHLGVAPGRYLGYSATTLPALTESITIEKNETMARHEEDRLVVLLEKLAKVLEPHKKCGCL